MLTSSLLSCSGVHRDISLIVYRILAVALVAGTASATWAQGGAAISVGISIQDSANAAADQSAANNAGATTPNNAAQQTTPSAGADAGGGADFIGEEEMDYSAEMGYEGAAGGQMGRGRRGSAAGGDMLNTVAGSLADSLAEFVNRPLSPSASQFQPTLYEQAAIAFHRGDQRLALTLFHAHLVAERDAANARLASVGFSPLLRRPIWALRLGVSINAKIPADLADDPQPIREDEKSGPARGGGAPGLEEYAQAPPAGRRRVATRGRSAQEPAEAEPQEAMEAAGFEMDAAAGFEMDAEGGYAPPAKAEEVPTTPGGSGSIVADETLDRHLGLVAEVLKAELAKRIEAGSFGNALPELATQGADLAAQGLPMPALGDTGNAPMMWIPGVAYLGTGIATQTLEMARENEIDLLFHFEIIVKETRGEEAQYIARCRVVNVATGDTLGASKLMDRRDVTLSARRSTVKAVVEEMLRPALDAVDSKAVVQPMPQLAPQHAISRIDALLASPQASRMNRLAEMAMFHQRGLIDDEQLEQAVYFAAGENGLRLLHAEYDQRRALATDMALKELETQ